MIARAIIRKRIVASGSFFRPTPSGSSSVRIYNSDLSFDEEFSTDTELADIEITKLDGSKINYPAIKDYIEQFQSITIVTPSGDPWLIISSFPTNGELTGPNINIIQVDGSDSISPLAEEYTCQWKNIILIDSKSNTLYTISSWPVAGKFMMADVTHYDSDGDAIDVPIGTSFHATLCKTLAQLVSESTALGIYNVMSPEQVTDMQALICDVCETLSELIAAASASTIYAAMSPEQVTDMQALICEVCETLSELIAAASASTIHAAMSPEQVTDMQAIICTPVEIIPNCVVPNFPPSSLWTGDLKWLKDNGYYDAVYTTSGKTVYILDEANHYYLDASNLNPWGNTDRFVFDDGSAAWNGTNFISAPGTATAHVIIDVYSGLMLYAPNLGTLTAYAANGFSNAHQFAMDKCLTLSVGSYTSGWRAMSIEEVMRLLINPHQFYYVSSANPFLRGTVSGFNETQFYLSAVDSAGTNAFVLTASGDIVRRAVTTTSLTTVYAVRSWTP